MTGLPLTVETMDRVAPQPTTALAPGSLLGEWRIEQQIGEGGMGTVYSAVHSVIGKHAAIKVIRGKVAENLHAAERFLQEARVVNQIQHPNIVDIFALGSLEDGRPYLVMELLHGESLGDRLDRGRIPAPEAVDILLQICDALAAAHGCGVVHRDLKPDNIFVCGPTVKLLDWGIAKMKDRPADAIDVTGEGSMVGTPRYIAPEQARGLPVDERTDVYSLGCIAHELFLEAPPFTADNVADLLVAHLREPVAPPSEVWPDIPKTLENLILGMLVKDTANRLSVAEVVDALEQARVELGCRVGGFATGSGPIDTTRSARGSGRIQRPTPAPAMKSDRQTPPPQVESLPVIGTEPTQLSAAATTPSPAKRSPWPGLVAATLALAVAAVTARVLVHYQPLAQPVTGFQVTRLPATIAPTVVPASATAEAELVLIPPAERVRDATPAAVTRSQHRSAAHVSAPAPTQAKKPTAHKRPGPRYKPIDPDGTIDPFAEP